MIRSTLMILLTAWSLFAMPARAESPVDVTDVLQLRVLPGWREAGGRHIAALEMELKPGWHTYWRTAGSLGISPAFNWRESANIRQVTPIWPAPEVFREAAGLSYGYTDRFVLPLVIDTWNTADSTRLEGQIDLGVCAEICVPARVRLAMDLPKPGMVDPAIESALAERPRQMDVLAKCRIQPDGDTFDLSMEIPVSSLGGQEAVVFELPGSRAWITDAETRRDGDILRADAQILGAKTVERSALRVTVLGTRGAVEFMGCRGG